MTDDQKISRVRHGVSTTIPTEYPIDGSHTISGRAILPVTLKVNIQDVNINLRLCGPGDIVGIDSRQIIRTEPRHLTTDFESRLV